MNRVWLLASKGGRGHAMAVMGLLVLLAGPQGAAAQSATDCVAPQTQQLMNACAAQDYARADAALNAAWGPARQFAKQIGQGDALLAAQRAWLTYRDVACAVQASPYEGGSIQPLIRLGCLTAVTEARTALLLEFRSY